MPKLKDLTPSHLRCSPCPAAFKAEDGDLIIIGKIVNAAFYPELEHRVGIDEQAVRVPAELINAAV